jgi:hypothetical protein
MEGNCFAIDVARTKKLKVFDIATEKMYTIQPKSEDILDFAEKVGESTWYVEEGGGFDLLKLLLLDKKCTVYTIPGIRVKEYRGELGLKKEKGETGDETDAKLIGQLAQKNPELFYRYEERDKIVTEISLWTKLRHDVERRMVVQKNQRSAVEDVLKFYSGKFPGAQGIAELLDSEIKGSQRLFDALRRVIAKKVAPHILWQKFLKDINGIGPVIAGDLIVRIRRPERFEFGKGRGKFRLRRLAGMVTKKGNQTFDHRLKGALYQYALGQVRHKNPKLTQFKEEYAKKHPDWTKGNVHNKAMKKLETKFLDQLFGVWKELERNGG